MTIYREILWLSDQGFSQQDIVASCNVSKKTVNRILHMAKNLGILWPMDSDQSNSVLACTLFRVEEKNVTQKSSRMRNFNYIHKEL